MPNASHVPLNRANRFAHIDAMRAFAVMVVVVAHAGAGRVVPGGSGVTIFFTISGFIITFLLLRERDATGGFSIAGFYGRRVFKIAPPFLAAIVAPTLLFTALGGHVHWRAVLAQVFFAFNWLKVDGIPVVLPGSGVVWSLSIEEQFYIGFALVWAVAVRWKHWAALTTCLAGAAVVLSTGARIAFAASPGMSRRIEYGSDTRIDGIAWGVLLAIAYFSWLKRGERSTWFSRGFAHSWALLGAVAVYCLSLAIRDDWFRDTIRYSLQSTSAAAVILYGLLPGEGRMRRGFYALSTWRPVALLGLASYSIYLTHLVVASALRPHLTGIPRYAEFVVLVLLGVGTGIALYYLIELPVQRARAPLRERDRLATTS